MRHDDDDKPVRRSSLPHRRVAKKPVHPPRVEDEDDDLDDEEDIDEEEEEARVQAARARYGARRRLERQQQEEEEEEDEDNDNDDDEEEEEEEDEFDLLRLLKQQENYQEQLRANRQRFASLLRSYPELQQRWQEFQRSGGVSSKDFEQFLNGRMRPRIIRQRKHLRLVSNRKGVSLKLIKKSDDDVA